ncbi:MAG: voltage-gated potassium channel [Moraxellaceae bacterium]|nr:MAG: voltage-gated potassium channel [Moraxellaceae bacterium]
MSRFTLSKRIYRTDEFEVRNYNMLFLTFVAVVILYLSIAVLAFLLLWAESGAQGANIETYGDAFWTLQMSASTIGFGDYYPVTLGGRTIVAAMFYIGVGIVGFIGAQVADRFLGFADTNVKNRELRKQNEQILEHNKVLEKKLDKLLSAMEPFSDKKD